MITTGSVPKMLQGKIKRRESKPFKSPDTGGGIIAGVAPNGVTKQPKAFATGFQGQFKPAGATMVKSGTPTPAPSFPSTPRSYPKPDGVKIRSPKKLGKPGGM